MTVAVSTASAVAQVYSVVPALYDLRIEIALVSIALITIANLRGLREAGLLFASPTYLFVGLALLMIGMGLVRVATGQGPATAPPGRARRAAAPSRSASSSCCARSRRARSP